MIIYYVFRIKYKTLNHFLLGIFASCPQRTVCFSVLDPTRHKQLLNTSKISPDSPKSVYQVAHIAQVIIEQKSSRFNSLDSPSADISPVKMTPPCSVTVSHSCWQKPRLKTHMVNMMAQSSCLSAINHQKQFLMLSLTTPLTFDNET